MYRERPLAELPGVLWELEMAEPNRVLPDGCTDVIWLGGRLIVAGPDTCAWLSQPANSRTTGLRFAPGVGPAVFGVAAHELRNRRLALDDLWPVPEVRRLEDELRTAADAAPILERAAFKHARTGRRDPAASWIAASLARGEPVSGIARRLGITERHLHRRSREAFGYGPKTLQRVLRLQHALSLVRDGVPAVGAALDAGYADQAHLAHEVRALAGVPLRRLLRA